MTHSHAFAAVLTALAALAAACHGPEADGPPELDFEPSQPARRAWTQAFQKEAVLVADEILIEGPPDLIDHVVLRLDPETNDYATKTVPQGLLQQLTAKPDSHVELQAQLDAWSLAAFRRITVLQRPGELPVTVRAVGEAYFAAGGDERREAQLVFQGVHGK